MKWMAKGERPTEPCAYYWCLRNEGRITEARFIVKTEEPQYLYVDGDVFMPWESDRFAGPIRPPEAPYE